jgi:hypothetical protein
MVCSDTWRTARVRAQVKRPNLDNLPQSRSTRYYTTIEANRGRVWTRPLFIRWHYLFKCDPGNQTSKLAAPGIYEQILIFNKPSLGPLQSRASLYIPKCVSKLSLYSSQFFPSPLPQPSIPQNGQSALKHVCVKFPSLVFRRQSNKMCRST